MEKLAVIGGGAAGLAAAIAAAAGPVAVTVYEGQKKPGRKLLMTGNGRCNLTHLDPRIEEAYGSRGAGAETLGSGEAQVVTSVLRRYDVQDTLAFFRALGVVCRDIDGYVYPRSGQAQTVLQALLAEAERLSVKLKYNTKVTGLTRDTDTGRWQLQTDGWVYEADRVILAGGGMAAPETGSDGSGYKLARDAGHSVTEVAPALTGLLCRDSDLALAAGARTRARVSLYEAESDRLLHTETGEVQWTDYGLSGIAVFQLSRYAVNRETRVQVDFVPEEEEARVADLLRQMQNHADGRMSVKQLLSAFIHERTAALLEQKLKTENPSRTVSVEAVARLLKTFSLPVCGARGFSHAQVTTGGIPLREVYPETLESRLASGLYFAGEILDVDGPCGGYNLQWAWSSGRAAGEAARRTAAREA